MEQLGKSIFFDMNLSGNGNQACASCHGPEVGFTGPIEAFNAAGAVYEGSEPGRFGNRKPPSAAYATQSPILHFVIEKKEAVFVGGNFWDGRATGEKLGNPAADQALGPFLNPVEQNNPSKEAVLEKIAASDYSGLWEAVWGEPIRTDTPENIEMNYDRIGLSIAAYEASFEVNQFSSKYDAYLAGEVDLTKQEKKGLHMFKGKGKCANCHLLEEPGRNSEPPLFTDYTFDNLGVPKNPENPVYDVNPDFIDLGLGGFLETRPDYEDLAEENLGKQKVPTLRNVDKRPYPMFAKAYTHNGYFKTLKAIVHFYNTRDVLPTCPGDYTEAQALAADCWPAPEVEENVNDTELGNLHLTEAQEDALVEFLKTLSDGYMP